MFKHHLMQHVEGRQVQYMVLFVPFTIYSRSVQHPFLFICSNPYCLLLTVPAVKGPIWACFAGYLSSQISQW